MMNTRRYFFLALIAIVVLSILYFFSDIVIYIVLAWVLSMIGAPMAKFLKKYVGKSMAAILTLGVFVIAFSLMLLIFIPPLINQVRNLASVDYENVISGVEEPLNDLQNWLEEKGMIDGQTATLETQPDQSSNESVVVEKSYRMDSLIVSDGDSLGSRNLSLIVNIQNPKPNLTPERVVSEPVLSISDKIRKKIFSLIDPSIIPQVFSKLFGLIGNLMIATMSVFFIAFFFLREQGLFNQMIASAIPDIYESRTTKAIEETSDLLIRYFTGIVVQIIAITIFVTLVLSILGIKNALLIGFFAALMNVIPYLGPFLGASFGIVITIASYADPSLADQNISFYGDIMPDLVKVVVVFFIMQLLDNFILQPTIFGKSVKAHPLEIFIVILMGAKIGGVAGMVLAIPIYTVVRVIAKVFLSEFKLVQSITKSL